MRYERLPAGLLDSPGGRSGNECGVEVENGVREGGPCLHHPFTHCLDSSTDESGCAKNLHPEDKDQGDGEGEDETLDKGLDQQRPLDLRRRVGTSREQAAGLEFAGHAYRHPHTLTCLLNSFFW